ncbi:MAG: hypothetical protein WCO98_13140 [bacterium]
MKNSVSVWKGTQVRLLRLPQIAILPPANQEIGVPGGELLPAISIWIILFPLLFTVLAIDTNRNNYHT